MIEITQEVLQATGITESELRQDVAVLPYKKGLSLMKAAGFARMDRATFQHLLASQGVPIHFTVEEYDHDVGVLASRSKA